jgi:hypothetical protein
VNGAKEWGEALYGTLLSLNPNFRPELWASADAPVFEGGFRAFMEDPSFEKFISH